jgi:DNA-directed RNA polymerase subunit RPC12/RpoP
MPRTCTVCRHEKRQEIDRALLVGRPLRNIAEEFGTSRMALCRHKAHRPVAEATDGDIHDVGTHYELREQEMALAAAGARYWCSWCGWQGADVGAIHTVTGLQCASCGRRLTRVVS